LPTSAPSPTSGPTRRSWAGVSAEDRKAERRTLLLDAALELLGTEGWSGTTVRGICAEAQLNPRYFYESFDDMDALACALHDRLLDELKAAVEAAVAKAPDNAAAQTRAVVDATARFVDEDRRRARVIYVEALGNEAVNRKRIDAGQALTQLMSGAVGPVAASLLVGGFSEVLVAWLDGRIPGSRDRLVDETTKLFLAVGEASQRKS
jgi:AcrR family transcriptional regulator